MASLYSDFLWRLAYRLRTRSFALPARGSLTGFFLAALGMLLGRPSRLEEKLDRALKEIRVLKRAQATYLGDGIALTYLADETPIFVNANDYGVSATVISGGVWEEDNLEVLLSFLRPNSVVADIGANFGFFSLKLAQRLSGKGRVHAFEPHPLLGELLKRSAHVNGLTDRIVLHPFGLSDTERTAEFIYPPGHLGGGYVANGLPQDESRVAGVLKPLDCVFADGTLLDLVKIDVEGHEPAVLRGMRAVIARSPSIAILLEKLVADAGYEEEIMGELAAQGLSLFAVGPSAVLSELDLAQFRRFGGYVLALRAGALDALSRSFFRVYPAQLAPAAAAIDGTEPGHFRAHPGVMLFSGPGWSLERGLWTVEIEGTLEGRLRLAIVERRGAAVIDLAFRPGQMARSFFLDHDLVGFECLARAASAVDLHLTSLKFSRHSERSLFKTLFREGSGDIRSLTRLGS